VNLDRSTGRCREKDIVVAMQLLAINPLQRDEVFLELVAKKADLAGLQPEDFFIKDLKTYVINDLRLGISVVPIRLEQWCKENPDLWSMIQTFRKSLRLDLYLIMTYAHTPRFKREIIGHGADRKVLTRLFSCCLVPFLGLTPMKNATLPLNYRDYFLCYDQKMVEISRKKLVPELNHCLQTVKKNRP
jgi:inorganic pyrophosphatase/exopolyphosphatase